MKVFTLLEVGEVGRRLSIGVEGFIQGSGVQKAKSGQMHTGVCKLQVVGTKAGGGRVK